MSAPSAGSPSADSPSAGSASAGSPSAGPPTALDRSRRPPPGPVPRLRLPELDAFRLENGLEVRVGESHRVPEISLRLLVEAGASAEPADRAGLADLTGRCLTEGAGRRTALETAEWLDRLGASFHASVRYDGAVLSMHLLSDVLPEALDFLATVVREPAFAPEEVERVRSERLDELERERDEPAIVADQVLIEAVHGSHLYGRPAGGTPESVEGLDAETVRGFHATRYGPRDGALVACGAVRPDELRRRLEERLGDWEAGTGRPEVGPPPERAVAAGRIVLVDRPGSPQAEIRVGAVGAAYGSDDFYSVLVANAILGGLFNSRLNLNLREDKGWTYGARTRFRFRRRRGPFVARTAVETRVAADSFREILSELRGMSERPPSDAELSLAKNALTRSLPLQFETGGQVSRKVIRQIAYDLPEDYWERYRERIEAVSREDVVAAADRYLGRDGLALVAVTDAAAVREALEELGPVETRPEGG